MNVIDIVLSIFLLWGFVRGFFKGFLLELAGLVALIAGIFGAIYLSGGVFNFLQEIFAWRDEYLSLLSFALTFIIIVIAISILGRILTKIVNFVALGIVNKILGAVFGLIKMAFMASVFFLFLNQLEHFSLAKETMEDSILYGPVERIAPLLLPTIIKEVNSREIFKTDGEEKE